MPLTTPEIALDQKHRPGDIEVFGRMNWRLRCIRLASVIGSPLPYAAIITNGSGYWATHVLMSGKLYLATCCWLIIFLCFMKGM